MRKRESQTNWEPLLAEAASYLLGLALKVRQPAGAVYHDGAEWSWMSEQVAAAGEHWDADMRDFIDNPDEVGRMFVLDALVFNEDRHRRNILVQPQADEARLRLWAIDAGESVIGWPADYIELGLAAPNPRNHARGLPIPALRRAALEAAQVAAQLQETLLYDIVAEACALAREPSVAPLAAALTARCRHAPALVSGYLDALGALP